MLNEKTPKNEENKNDTKEKDNNQKEENKINEIKEESEKVNNEEKKENKAINEPKFRTSPFRKIFNLNNNNSKLYFLTGIEKNESLNNYNIFVPNIYLKELEEEYQMIIYLSKGIMFFLFFDKKFEVIKQIEQIEKIPKRISKYFKDQFESIKELEKLQTNENNIFCYKNSCNKSIKYSGFINKKNNNSFDWKLFETLQRSLFINGDTEMTSLAKYKGGFYIYYIQSIGQEVAMFFKDGLTLSQVKQEIEKTKKIHFDNLFLN